MPPKRTLASVIVGSVPPPTVTGRTGRCLRAARADTQHAAVVYPRQAAATRADRIGQRQDFIDEQPTRWADDDDVP